MLINIMVTTVAADPAVALEPRDHLVPVGFQLQHTTLNTQIYAQPAIFVKQKCAINYAIDSTLKDAGGQQPFAQGSECVSVRPDLSPGATTLHGVARSRVRPAEAMRVFDLSWVKSGASFVGSVYLRGFSFPDFRSRTPGPPPFSSMNSTPAFSKARLTTGLRQHAT